MSLSLSAGDTEPKLQLLAVPICQLRRRHVTSPRRIRDSGPWHCLDDRDGVGVAEFVDVEVSPEGRERVRKASKHDLTLMTHNNVDCQLAT